MYGICNVVGASIPRNTDSGTYIHVGPEIGVASTKAFTGQVTVLMLLALCVGQMRGTVDDATVERIVRELKNMPLYILILSVQDLEYIIQETLFILNQHAK